MLKRFNCSFSLLASCVFLDYIISSAKNPSSHQENELFPCQLAGISVMMSFTDARMLKMIVRPGSRLSAGSYYSYCSLFNSSSNYTVREPVDLKYTKEHGN